MKGQRSGAGITSRLRCLLLTAYRPFFLVEPDRIRRRTFSGKVCERPCLEPCDLPFRVLPRGCLDQLDAFLERTFFV